MSGSNCNIYIYMGYFLTTCFGQNEPLSGDTYIKLYKQELLHYKLFELKWDLTLQLTHFRMKCNYGVYRCQLHCALCRKQIREFFCEQSVDSWTTAIEVILIDEECIRWGLVFVYPSTELSFGFFIVSNV